VVDEKRVQTCAAQPCILREPGSLSLEVMAKPTSYTIYTRK